MCTSSLRGDVTARAEVEERQRGGANGALPPTVTQMSVPDAEFLKGGDLEKRWE
jgi:hypothetical protein